ncbi:hypothetical protein ACTA71_006397 [Dictyostelium dimigraforme]
MEINKTKQQNDNKKLPDYLDFNIIQIIVDFLLIRSNNNKFKSSKKKSYRIKLYARYYNEIIILSKVSKKWFNFISLLISSNLIAHKSFESDCTIFENNTIFVYVARKRRRIGNFKINQPYSIIKIDEKIISLFKDFITFEEFLEIMDNKEEIKKVLQTKIGRIERYIPFYILLDFTEKRDKIKKELNIDLTGNNFKFDYTQIDENDERSTKIDNIRINTLHIFQILNAELLDLNVVYNLKPKNIKFKGSHILSDGSPIFNIKLSSTFPTNEYSNRLRSISMGDCSLQFYSLNGIDSLFPNLVSLHVRLPIYSLFRTINDSIDNYNIIKDRCLSPGTNQQISSLNLQNQYNNMINSLIKSKSLKNLTIDSFSCPSCFKFIELFNSLDKSKNDLLSNGIKLLLSSNLYYLHFNEINFIQNIQYTFSPLFNSKEITINKINNNKNSSIKVLTLENSSNSNVCSENDLSFDYYYNIIEHLLSNANNIRIVYLYLRLHFSEDLKSRLFSLIFNTLIKQQSDCDDIIRVNSNLYGIGIRINENDFEKIFDHIKLLSLNQKPNSRPIVKEFFISINFKSEFVGREIYNLNQRIKNEFYNTNKNNDRIIITIV